MPRQQVGNTGLQPTLPSPLSTAPSPNPAGAVSPPTIFSDYLITLLFFGHCCSGTIRLLYVRSWQQLQPALQAALWHSAPAGTAASVLAKWTPHCCPVWTLGGCQRGKHHAGRCWSRAENQKWETISICFQPLESKFNRTLAGGWLKEAELQGYSSHYTREGLEHLSELKMSPESVFYTPHVLTQGRLHSRKLSCLD